ncbi:MAG: ABCB family ABC transporter ATP-binding protein/permease [Burkholderiales bacterium]|jgi:ATP-binding cassette subfamily B protein|nr:ABC transporter ATP-binding protein/permease [Betaproteobacteria bacterium]
MRHFPAPERPTKTFPLPAGAPRGEWQTLKTLVPYLLQYKWRVVIALTCLVLAKVANVAVPVVLKDIVDLVSVNPIGATIAVPLGLVLAYGALRVLTTLFTELREVVFARVTQQAVRRIALQVFEHLHALSLRFHLDRQTGGLTRDIERGTRGVSSLVSFTLYSILPTVIEVFMVLAWLVVYYEIWFAVITIVALTVYVLYTIAVTEWRTNFRRVMNDLDSRANTRAVDSLLNYETVKYFNNEKFESQRYDQSMARWQEAAIKSQTSLSVLNVGQSLIIAAAVTLMVWRATLGVIEGRMTLGDLVLVNAFMIQLYIPLNFLGVLYREIKQSLADMERMFGLMAQHREIDDNPDAKPLVVRGGEVVFQGVSFAYDAARPILRNVDLRLPAGQITAVVGSSGAGKSTLSRLLYRFYDLEQGAIRIDGQEIRSITQSSLRAVIGIVPQDTVLFNDTLEYNIRYGRPDASDDEIRAVAEAAHLTRFIASLPDGMQTRVGERGLKLSGGEKQRVAIARALLKRPALLIFDEATSALDSESEKAIQAELMEVSKGRTTLVIAHRLSTIVDADQIVVLENGQIVEHGRHAELLGRRGRYAELWELQAREARAIAH